MVPAGVRLVSLRHYVYEPLGAHCTITGCEVADRCSACRIELDRDLGACVSSFNLFNKTYCARILRWIATIGVAPQADLMAHFHDRIGGCGGFTYAFERFTFGAHHLIRRRSRERGDVFANANRGYNLVSWIGAKPLEWIAAQSDAALTRGFELLEWQVTANEAAPLADADLTFSWFEMVRAEMARRS